jgi:hypothetical protein
MSQTQFAFAALLAAALLSGCAGSGADVGSSNSGPLAMADENGGKIPNSVGSASGQSSAYQMVTAHCEKFGKTGFITKMDYDSGTLTFECRLQKPRRTG